MFDETLAASSADARGEVTRTRRSLGALPRRGYLIVEHALTRRGRLDVVFAASRVLRSCRVVEAVAQRRGAGARVPGCARGGRGPHQLQRRVERLARVPGDENSQVNLIARPRLKLMDDARLRVAPKNARAFWSLVSNVFA